MDKKKFCPSCKKTKVASGWPKHKNRRGGLGSVCKSCMKSSSKNWYKKNAKRRNKQTQSYYEKNKDRQKDLYLQRKFGITLDQYNEMLVAQNGVCKLCNRPERAKQKSTGKVKSLAVDHCHDSNRVRGLLCYHCNHIIACLGDNEESAEKLLMYMKGEM